MAAYCITIPGSNGVSMQKGDTLTITFLTPAKFCITSGSATDFNPTLPVGVAEPKHFVWTGTATATNSTINYSSVGHDKACGADPKATAPGSIIIGSGMPK